MSTTDAVRRANRLFDRVTKNPKDPNGQIIGARRGNSAKAFDLQDILKRVKNAKKRVKHAEKAIEFLKSAD